MGACWALGSATHNEHDDKEREKDKRALAHLVKRLHSIQANLENLTQASMLEHLIATALRNLGVDVEDSTGKLLPGKRNPPGRKHPRFILRTLAWELAREFGVVEPGLLLEIAKSTGIGLAKRDAQRYCQTARNSITASAAAS
jgi:hypothetical protein